MTCKRPPYEMPYSYFPDADEEHWKKKNIYDIDVWLEQCTKTCCGEEFLLPQKSGADGEYIENAIGTPFKSPYYRSSNIENKFSGHPAFIFCPGPSLGEVDLEAFRGCLTIAVNSAGFKFKPEWPPYLWGIAEANYMNWFYRRGFCRESVFLWNARSAFRYMARNRKLLKRDNLWSEDKFRVHNKFKAAFIHRWEEEKTIPPRTSAPSTTAALVGAWKLGCDSAYVIGMDLSKPEGKTYIDSVPVTSKGLEASFEWQLKSLKQFYIPGFKIFNGSPHSGREDLPFVPSTYEEITDIARSSDSVPAIEEFIDADKS